MKNHSADQRAGPCGIEQPATLTHIYANDTADRARAGPSGNSGRTLPVPVN